MVHSSQEKSWYPQIAQISTGFWLTAEFSDTAEEILEIFGWLTPIRKFIAFSALNLLPASLCVSLRHSIRLSSFIAS